MTKTEALQALNELKHNSRSLSDEFLRERGCTTRQNIGLGGEYLYGVWMVPEDTVIAMCEALLGSDDE